ERAKRHRGPGSRRTASRSRAARPGAVWRLRGSRARSSPSPAGPRRAGAVRGRSIGAVLGPDEPDLDAATGQRSDHVRWSRLVGEDDVDLLGRAERREGRPSPFRVIDDRDDLASGRHHRPLDLGLLVGRIREARLEGEPGGTEERLLDIDPAEEPVAELADDRERLPADATAEHEDG